MCRPPLHEVFNDLLEYAQRVEEAMCAYALTVPSIPIIIIYYIFTLQIEEFNIKMQSLRQFVSL